MRDQQTRVLSAAESAARQRHPSARWPSPPDHLRRRVAELLDLHGAPYPEVAAAVLERRGSTGLDVEPFAARVGVAAAQVRRAQVRRDLAGLGPPALLPPSLRRLLAS